MKELTMHEMEQVNGGMIPVIIAIVAIDAGCLCTMWAMYVSKYG